MNSRERKWTTAWAYIALGTSVLIWGSNFAVVKGAAAAWSGSESTFLAIRFWVAFVALAASSLVQGRWPRLIRAIGWQSSLAAVGVGLALAVGYASQFCYLGDGTSVGAAFLTCTSVVWAAALAILWKDVVPRTTLGAAVIACAGSIAIVADGGMRRPWMWEVLGLVSAIAFACEILMVSKWCPPSDVLAWTCCSTGVVAVVMTTVALFREPFSGLPNMTAPRILSVVYTGIVASAVALALQNWAQAQMVSGIKVIDGPRAAIISSLEPVVAAVIGVALLGEPITVGLGVGGMLVLGGVLLSELSSVCRIRPATPDGGDAS